MGKRTKQEEFDRAIKNKSYKIIREFINTLTKETIEELNREKDSGIGGVNKENMGLAIRVRLDEKLKYLIKNSSGVKGVSEFDSFYSSLEKSQKDPVQEFESALKLAEGNKHDALCSFFVRVYNEEENSVEKTGEKVMNEDTGLMEIPIEVFYKSLQEKFDSLISQSEQSRNLGKLNSFNNFISNWNPNIAEDKDLHKIGTIQNFLMNETLPKLEKDLNSSLLSNLKKHCNQYKEDLGQLILNKIMDSNQNYYDMLFDENGFNFEDMMGTVLEHYQRPQNALPDTPLYLESEALTDDSTKFRKILNKPLEQAINKYQAVGELLKSLESSEKPSDKLKCFQKEFSAKRKILTKGQDNLTIKFIQTIEKILPKVLKNKLDQSKAFRQFKEKHVAQKKFNEGIEAEISGSKLPSSK